PQFVTDSLKSWSLSVWVKLKNNGSKQTMLFQSARPGYHWGNINLQLNTNSYPATNDSVIRLQPRFTTANATVTTTATTGLQDNLNSVIDKFNLNDWLHVVLTYDISSGTFNNWINGVKVGNFSGRGTNPTTQLFRLWQPNEIIIGSNYNGIPGKAVNSDVAVAPMTGQVDELRIYNISLPDAYVRALYNLGKAKQ
ncbi:MAG: LamG domain-containing protein, partial [Chitinophagaceae bacterium]